MNVGSPPRCYFPHRPTTMQSALCTTPHSRATPCRRQDTRMAPQQLEQRCKITTNPRSMVGRRIPVPFPALIGKLVAVSPMLRRVLLASTTIHRQACAPTLLLVG